jgi:signal peptidase I
VFVNSRLLHESYLPQGVRTSARKLGDQLVRLGADQYFVMGDNRGRSHDSRMYGPVTRRDLLGTVAP